MRYWVYQDSQILGPLERSEMERLEALGPGTLVCHEEAAGGLQSDWRALGEIPELAGLGAGVLSTVGSLVSAEPQGSWLLEDREVYGRHFSPPREPGPAEEAAGPSLWWDAFDRGAKSKHQEVAEAEARAQEIEKTVSKLHRRIEELESQQGELLRQLLEKGWQTPLPAEPPAPRFAPLPKVPEAAAPPLPDIFSTRLTVEQPPTPPPPAPVPEAAPPPAVFEAAPPQAPAAKSIFKAQAPKSWPSAAKQSPQEPAAAPVSKFGAPKAFPKAGEGGAKKLFPVSSAPKAAPAPGGLHIPPAARHKEASASSSIPEPQIPSLAPQAEADLAPPPSPFAPPEPMPSTDPGAVPAPASDPPAEIPVPPLTRPKAKPKEAPAAEKPIPAPLPVTLPPSSPFAFIPAPLPPVDLGKTNAPAPTPAAPPPATMSFSAPSIPAAPPVPTPQEAPAPAPADAAVHTQEVLSRLAKPRDGMSTTAPKAKKRQSRFAVIISVSFVAFLVLAVLFFRNTKDIKMMFVGNGATSKPLGVEAEDAAPAKGPGPAVPAPAPAAPAPKPEAVADPSPAAIELVKQYPLDGGRGTVGQWLQYSFAANPGDAAKEKWNAGAVSATTYLVQYTVPGAGPAGGGINYIFEADLQAKTVKGNNPDAKLLLSPQTPAPAKAQKAAKKAKAARRKPAQAPAKRAAALLPLPSDSDLAPPSDDSSQFSTDTVN